MIDIMAKSPTITIRLPNDLLEWLKETAQREHRSVNGQIVHILEQARDQKR